SGGAPGVAELAVGGRATGPGVAAGGGGAGAGGCVVGATPGVAEPGAGGVGAAAGGAGATAGGGVAGGAGTGGSAGWSFCGGAKFSFTAWSEPALMPFILRSVISGVRTTCGVNTTRISFSDFSSRSFEKM